VEDVAPAVRITSAGEQERRRERKKKRKSLFATIWGGGGTIGRCEGGSTRQDPSTGREGGKRTKFQIRGDRRKWTISVKAAEKRGDGHTRKGGGGSKKNNDD